MGGGVTVQIQIQITRYNFPMSLLYDDDTLDDTHRESGDFLVEGVCEKKDVLRKKKKKERFKA